MDLAGINERTYSSNANSFKSAWTPLISDDAARSSFQERFNIPKYSHFEAVFTEVNQVNANTFKAIGLCRSKVCEISAARPLARPLKKDEKRGDVVAKTKTIVDSLGGELPAGLGLLFFAEQRTEYA